MTSPSSRFTASLESGHLMQISGYQARTHRIWRTARQASHLVLPVLPE